MEHISIGIINILKRGADAGYWTVDQIDRPSPGWTEGTKVDRRLFQKGLSRHQAPQPAQGIGLRSRA